MLIVIEQEVYIRRIAYADVVNVHWTGNAWVWNKKSDINSTEIN
jgi:hypothetical protein